MKHIPGKVGVTFNIEKESNDNFNRIFPRFKRLIGGSKQNFKAWLMELTINDCINNPEKYEEILKKELLNDYDKK